MNLPNKLTIGRIVMAGLIIAILLFPFEAMGISTMKFFVNESLVIDIKYLIAGVLFVLASFTDFLDGYIARKYNMVTDFGKMTDAIADKMLVNSVLIILASTGFISAIIPVVVVLRDTVVDVIKMIVGNKGKAVAAIKSGKIKTACLMVGITLTLFYNLPFELINIRVSDVLLIIATVMSIISGVQYYTLNKKALFE
jgi:CDP-diacylglycerol--glycerol-3-phosphate 3-phosphatidyltransferase